MPPTRSHIRATVETYLARHPQEREALADLLVVLDGTGDPSSRATLPGHVTCSAVVIDRDRRVLHIGHKASGLLLAPGGHVEASDRTLLAAALREVGEEAGIHPRDLSLTPQFLGSPIDIDVHDIDANPAKREPAHQHYDFRFAFYLAAEQPPPLELQGEEVSGAEWRPFADVRSPTLRAKLLGAEANGLDGRPEPVNASALIHDGQGRYLLHLRDQREGIGEPGVFALLGGGRKMGDPCLEATLRRELAEEAPGLEPTGLTPYAGQGRGRPGHRPCRCRTGAPGPPRRLTRRAATHRAGLPGPVLVRDPGGPGARPVRGVAVVEAPGSPGRDRAVHPDRDRRHPRRPSLHRAGVVMSADRTGPGAKGIGWPLPSRASP